MRRRDDLRAISLKYSGHCRSCSTVLDKGERAYWSKSTKQVWCIGCAGGESSSTRPTSDPATQESKKTAARADSISVKAPKPGTGSSHACWQQLCTYARHCVEAQAAKSLVPYIEADSLWFFHSGEEQLVSGQSDSTPAPEKLAKRLGSLPQLQDSHSIIYGWPMVVVPGHDHKPKVAPLFSIRIEPERVRDNEWCLHAVMEPEFNPAVTASSSFDPQIREEIGELLGQGLPFGDADAFAVIAARTADLLGLTILSPLDATALDTDAGCKQGVYNAAVSVVAETSEYGTTLIEELRRLGNREDWGSTAAAHLVPQGFVPDKARRPPSGPLAAPLICNQSQEKTLCRLRSEPLTIVTGPPGTGKTQLVVNAVTNSWLDGDKVLVTSTNNAAVDVAVARAAKDICGGLLMRTGNRSEREQVPARISAASGQSAKQAGTQAEARARLQRTASKRAQLMNKLALLDELDKHLLCVAKKLEKAASDLNEAAQVLWTDGRLPELPIDSCKIEQRAGRLMRAWFFPRLRAQRLRRRLGCMWTAPLQGLVTWARLEQQQSKLTLEWKAKRDEHRKLKDAVGDPATAVSEVNRQWAQASLLAIRVETAERIRPDDPRLALFGRTSAGGRQFKQAVTGSFESLRGWACTALSASSNFPLEPGLFDLVIVDEASQCSLAAVLPLAYRAKRLAVVGDPCQLHPIVPLGDRLLWKIAEQTGFDNDDLRRRGIHHKDGSAYFAFEFAMKPDAPVLLDEHYRCHPRIARWFNRTFYNDRLTVLTEVAKTGRSDRTILWQDIDGVAERPAKGTSWLNRAEAEQVVKWLGGLLESGSTVGVVTPFLAQAQYIERIAERRFGVSALAEAGFVCGTAHRLQGDERDAIIISAVLSPHMSPGSVLWIEKEKNLLNVAVSRARMALVVFGHPEVGNSPSLSSLRTYLRDEAAGKGDALQGPASFRTDSEAEELLLRAMQSGNLLPYAKLDVEGYELDFALMEQGIKMNIEVDGDQHIDGRGHQRRQDLTRDRVLSGIGWVVLRIPAWQCHKEIDLVMDEIRKTRERLLDGAVAHCSH